MEPPLLLDLAIKALIDNIDKLDKDLVKTIIVPFRQKMLKEMFEMLWNHHLTCDGEDDHNDKLWAILPFLINSKYYTKLDTLDLPGMVCPFSTVTNSRFQEFFRGVGANTPNLRELIIRQLTVREEYSLEERELNSIIQLKNLAFLYIQNVQVPLSGILDMSRECKKLDCIRANKVIIDVQLSCAAFGDNFAYIYIEAYDFYLGRTSLYMARTMRGGSKYKDYTHYIHLRLRPRTNQELFLLAQRFAEKLKEIRIVCTYLNDAKEIDEFPHLPQIKRATILSGRNSAHVLRCFLKINGQSLQELSLCDVGIEEKMAFSEIFNLCPNLKSLELNACTLVGNDAPVDSMQQLKRFSWCSKNASDEVAFSSILSAPLLEDIYIDLPKIDFSDNATIIEAW
ncbi:Hypothetical predicted protein [Cloeon dipterum]|uniref:Uncharacterized protein n=1 Tax=Cloeon dipterum TaxID=197152 RepID=A0A8S1DLU2_9INSE|nr:Hypothetical predicted protein [Cloeon dipterum]